MSFSGFKITFNSSQSNSFSLHNFDKVSFIRINNSPETYYKDGIIDLYNLSAEEENSLHINSTVRIWINNSLEFDGYLSRIQKSLYGTRYYRLQGIGKTYDLWRYHTSSNTKYNKVYSGYIVSSLVSTYTPINPPSISPTVGSYIDTIDLSNLKIGDAIARLSSFDGYHFYVDSSNTLRYYQVENDEQFSLTEDDILNMSPIEHSDDYVRNKVLVVGALEFESKDPTITPPYQSGNFITISSNQTLVAQRITVPTNLLQSKLSAINILVKRTTGEDTPFYLRGDVRENESDLPGSFVISSDRIVWNGPTVLYTDSGSWTDWYFFPNHLLPLSSSSDYWIVYKYDGATPSSSWYLNYSMYDNSSSTFSVFSPSTSNWFNESGAVFKIGDSQEEKGLILKPNDFMVQYFIFSSSKIVDSINPEFKVNTSTSSTLKASIVERNGNNPGASILSGSISISTSDDYFDVRNIKLYPRDINTRTLKPGTYGIMFSHNATDNIIFKPHSLLYSGALVYNKSGVLYNFYEDSNFSKNPFDTGFPHKTLTSSNTYFGQTLKLSGMCIIDNIRLVTRFRYSGTGQGKMYLEFWDANSGYPNNPIPDAPSSSIDISSFSNNDWKVVHFYFDKWIFDSGNIALVTYFRNTGSSFFGIDIAGSESDKYPNGQSSFSYDAGNTWSNSGWSGFDFSFYIGVSNDTIGSIISGSLDYGRTFLS